MNDKIFAAFLRGINVGGHKKVDMKELKKAFESLGFENVKTLLNSGNAIFEADEDQEALTKKIAMQLEKTFGFEIGVIVRSIEELKNLAEKEPFKGIKVTPATRLYVTFLAEKSTPYLKIPYQSADKNFKILSATPSEVCSVLTVAEGGRTVDLMAVLEKEWGKKITTRNWNTITKMTKLT